MRGRGKGLFFSSCLIFSYILAPLYIGFSPISELINSLLQDDTAPQQGEREPPMIYENIGKYMKMYEKCYCIQGRGRVIYVYEHMFMTI